MKSQKPVLLIEDDRGIQGLISTLLSRRGIALEIAPDGEAALRMIRQKDYAALLLDLMLPRVNGFEVIRELKVISPELLQKTIVVTAASDLTLRDFDHSQVNRLLRKPFSISELLDAVELCLNGNGQSELQRERPGRLPASAPAGS